MKYNRRGESTSQTTIIWWIIGLVVLVLIIVAFLFFWSSSKRKTGSIQEQIEGVDLNLGDFFQDVSDLTQGKDLKSVALDLSIKCSESFSETENKELLKTFEIGYKDAKERKLPEIEEGFKTKTMECNLILRDYDEAKKYGYDLDKVCDGSWNSELINQIDIITKKTPILTEAQLEKAKTDLKNICDLEDKDLNKDVKARIEAAINELDAMKLTLFKLNDQDETVKEFSKKFNGLVQKTIAKDYTGALADTGDLINKVNDLKYKNIAENKYIKTKIKTILYLIKSRLVIYSGGNCNDIPTVTNYKEFVGTLFSETSFSTYFDTGQKDFEGFKGVIDSAPSAGSLDSTVYPDVQLAFDKATCQKNKGSLATAVKIYEDLLKNSDLNENSNIYPAIVMVFDDYCNNANEGKARSTVMNCEDRSFVSGQKGLSHCVFIDDYDDSNLHIAGVTLDFGANEGSCVSCASVLRSSRNCKAYEPTNKVWLRGQKSIVDLYASFGDDHEEGFGSNWDSTCEDDPCNFNNGNCNPVDESNVYDDKCLSS
ncbi:MAG: hypothetical protein PHT54_01465 [Candidatus Nanoarchaeia archaeon]|nr:hypothetical protein [Candidatus Nanoarchaeia archaeon]